MGNDLDSFSEIVASTLSLYHVLVDLARGDVVLTGEGNVEITFAETNQRFDSIEKLRTGSLIPKIQIHFSTIVKYKHLPVPRQH